MKDIKKFNHRNDNNRFSNQETNKRFTTNKFQSGPKELYDATCSKCNKLCKVPFKPREGKPVYCKDCFSKNRY